MNFTFTVKLVILITAEPQMAEHLHTGNEHVLLAADVKKEMYENMKLVLEKIHCFIDWFPAWSQSNFVSFCGCEWDSSDKKPQYIQEL